MKQPFSQPEQINAKTTMVLDNSDHAFFVAMQALSDDLLFRLNLTNNHMELFGKMCTHYNLPNLLENFPEGALPYVDENDHNVLLTTAENMRNGIEVSSYLRLRCPHGALRWHRHEYILRYDADGKPVEALGKIVDVHEKKELEDRILLDPLTGCLRKESFESLCISYLSTMPTKSHALFMIDLDNFKIINDNLGHHFGDMVLREVGEHLHTLFRNSDYIGRVGGDEFMVFMRSIDDLTLVRQKAQAIVDALNITYHGAQHAYTISCSVGIAIAPQDGDNFCTLYEHADIALYDVKNRGKNGIALYHNALSKGTMENTTPFDVALRTLSQHFNPDFVADVFNLLYETNDLDVSMQRVLHLMGERFGASRCYVFEKSKSEHASYDNTYEWCAAGIVPQIDDLQGLPAELIGQFLELANEAGIFYCNDLSALPDEDSRALMSSQGIQSFLHAYLYSGDVLTCTIGLDDCNTARVWSPIEISTLLYVSKIIGQFINYKNALASAYALSEDSLSVLDSLNPYAYIIDIDTHTLSYFNKATQAVLPNLKKGDTCYRALRGHSQECNNCPLKALRNQKGLTHTQNLIYNKLLHIPVLVNATLLPRFDGKESVFVSSTDVSSIIDKNKMPID